MRRPKWKGKNTLPGAGAHPLTFRPVGCGGDCAPPHNSFTASRKRTRARGAFVRPWRGAEAARGVLECGCWGKRCPGWRPRAWLPTAGGRSAVRQPTRCFAGFRKSPPS